MKVNVQKPLFRLATPVDVPGISSVLMQTFPGYYCDERKTAEWIMQHMGDVSSKRRAGAYYVAERYNEIIGCAHWTEEFPWIKENWLFLKDLAVAPAYRRNRIGHRLLKESLRQYDAAFMAPEDRYIEAVMLLIDGTRDDLRRFYRRHLGAVGFGFMPYPDGTVRLLFARRYDLYAKVNIRVSWAPPSSQELTIEHLIDVQRPGPQSYKTDSLS